MKHFLLILICSTPILINAQASGSGTIIWYGVNGCTGGCSEETNISDQYIYTAPEDGTLQITGIVTPFSIDCCGNIYQLSISGGFRKLLAPANIHNFSSSTSTGTLDCVKKGDQFEINFSGTYGEYSYSASILPASVAEDNEPNDTNTEAVSVSPNTNYTGHIGYGAYVYDFTDYYEFIPPNDGTLVFNFDQTGNCNFNLYDKNLTLIGGQTNQAGISSFKQECLSEGDKIYIRYTRFQDCTDYTFNMIFMEPVYGIDIEPNDDLATAQIGNDIHGSVGYDYGSINNDFDDYFEIGNFAIGDSIAFDITVASGPVSFSLRSKTFSGFNYNLGTLTDASLNAHFKPYFDDIFYLKVSANTSNCGSYEVSMSGCVDNLVLTGTESNTMDMQADNSILSNQIIENNADVKYNANNYTELVNSFEVILGGIFEIFTSGCDLN